MIRPDPLSVLVVDEDPAILEFIARMLDSNGMRALLAHSAQEAIEIAQRGYVPINLVLTDVVVKESHKDAGALELTGAELVNRLREIRPDLRAMYMSAFVDSGIIRIRLMKRHGMEPGEKFAESNFIASIGAEATAPLAFRNGGSTQ
jgi:CheY-like chemotaxis protein